MSIANIPLPDIQCTFGIFQAVLTRLLQNLTLHKDNNLIPSAHRTQQLSYWSNHWIGVSLRRVFLSKGPFQRGEVRQLTMHSFRREQWPVLKPALGSNTQPSVPKGKHANQYTTIASSICNSFYSWIMLVEQQSMKGF